MALPYVKCDICGKEFRNVGVHKRLAHAKVGAELLSSAAPACTPAQSDEYVFFSPRAKDMVVVIRPEMWMVHNTPHGTYRDLHPGLRAEFKKGILRTRDPEVIEYLLHTYDDKRHPILCQSEIRGTIKKRDLQVEESRL